MANAQRRIALLTALAAALALVGEAMEMGFLFLDKEHGAYMVALTCENPDCDAPRTGIRLHGSEFLWDG